MIRQRRPPRSRSRRMSVFLGSPLRTICASAFRRGSTWTWDSTVTTVTLGGAASAKVSTTLLGFEDGDRTAVIDVVTDFAGG